MDDTPQTTIAAPPVSTPSAAPAEPVHVMLDIETMGTRPGAAILSIGACVFWPANEAASFYAPLQGEGQAKLGLHLDWDTVCWWSRQDESARAQVFGGDAGRMPLGRALTEFARWLDAARGQPDRALRLWCNGPSFDPVLLETAYRRCKWRDLPWRYNEPRCLRTLLEQAGLSMRDFAPTTAHHALEDALAQARAATAAFAVLGR